VVARVMTVPAIDVTVAIAVVAAGVVSRSFPVDGRAGTAANSSEISRAPTRLRSAGGRRTGPSRRRLLSRLTSAHRRSVSRRSPSVSGGAVLVTYW
jgi:hypothetical protein